MPHTDCSTCPCDHCRLIRIEHKLDTLLDGDAAQLAELLQRMRANRARVTAALAAASPAAPLP